MLMGIVSGNSNVLKVIVQEVLIRDEFSVIVQEVLMGGTSLIVIVVIMAVKGETFSIKQYPVPNMGQVKFTYVII